MIEDRCPRKILVIAMLNSIHTARWLSQFTDAKHYDVHLYNSVNEKVHPLINTILFTLHNGELENVIDTLNPDIIHTLEMQHSAYLLLPIREKREKFPIWLYSCWGSDIKWFKDNFFHKKKIQKILDYIDAMFCEDLENIEIAKNIFNFNKPFLKVPGPGGYKVDEMRAVGKFILPSKRKIIAVKGYTGWVYKPKTVFLSLNACSKEIINGGYEVVVYLPGKVDKYIEVLKSKGVKVKRFELTSNYSDMLFLFSRSRINIAASISDGVPNSMLEGMVMGAYPIQSAVNPVVLRDFIEDEKNGILLDPLDINGYTLAIKKILENDKLVDLAAKKNLSLIKRKIDYYLIKKKVLDFFDTFYILRSDFSFQTERTFWFVFGITLKVCFNFLKNLIKKMKNFINNLLCFLLPSYKKLFYINEKVILIDKKMNIIVDNYDVLVKELRKISKKIN